MGLSTGTIPNEGKRNSEIAFEETGEPLSYGYMLWHICKNCAFFFFLEMGLIIFKILLIK